MTTRHAVLFVDHQAAQLLQFDAEQVQAQKIKAHKHPTKQHGSAVRAEHEYFASVCDALAGIAEVLVVGPHTGLADFQHYLNKHRPALLRQVADFQAVDHPTEHQLVALAREFFLKHDRMAGAPGMPGGAA